MRYYDLFLLNGAGQVLANTSAGLVSSKTSQPTFSSQFKQQDGQLINDPGALQIDFDIPVTGYALPQGNAFVRVSGVGLRTLSQSSNLNSTLAQNPLSDASIRALIESPTLNVNPAAGTGGPAKFILKAGWTKGLPLANDYVARGLTGVIAQGLVFNAYGNWEGTEQSLDLNLIAANMDPPTGFNLVWLPGQPLSTALENCLAAGFPGLKVDISGMLPNLLQSTSSQQQTYWYPSFSQLADVIFQQTKVAGAALTGKKTYPGVLLAFNGNTVYANDGTQADPSKAVKIAFQDLIGQPTWIDINTINFKSVLRADLKVGDFCVMPPDPGGGTSIISALALTQQGAAVPGAPARNSSIFKGSFYVNEVHHFGNSRSPDGASWATTFNAIAQGS